MFEVRQNKRIEFDEFRKRGTANLFWQIWYPYSIRLTIKRNKMSEEKHYAWPSIESFHAIRKFTHAKPNLIPGETTKVAYKGKVKLHGTNAGIQCHSDGKVIAQSRENLLIDRDNSGFAAWVTSKKSFFSELGKKFGNIIVYGEWCGAGIQSGVAISQIGKKVFAIFAIVYMPTMEDQSLTDMIFEPSEIEGMLKIPEELSSEIKVLPWHGSSFTVNWGLPAEDPSLLECVENINRTVKEVEDNDPWVEANFGVKGTGEGLVYFPILSIKDYRKHFSNLCFKAKGEKHQTVRAKAASVTPEKAAGVTEFVSLVLTEARLNQGVEKGCEGEFSKKKIPAFISWVCQDVYKECQGELEASVLHWSQVQKDITNAARTWYLSKC